MKKFLLMMILSSTMFGFDFKIYPKAKDNEVMQTISLQPKDDENSYKVEISFGKKMKLDCNNYFFAGKNELKKENLEGWGYDYYKFSVENEALAGTKMMCPPNYKNEEKFISFNKDLMLEYNSKLPIVIYTPKDVVVKYRILKAIEENEAKIKD